MLNGAMGAPFARLSHGMMEAQPGKQMCPATNPLTISSWAVKAFQAWVNLFGPFATMGNMLPNYVKKHPPAPAHTVAKKHVWVSRLKSSLGSPACNNS